MILFQRKLLRFDSKHWFFGGKWLYYVRRIPRTDKLLIHKDTVRTPNHIKVISINDFIMLHPDNKDRREAAYFVFQSLEWWDNICIKRAILEYNAIALFQDSVDLRIVNGEVWAITDYELDQQLGQPSITGDRPYSSYPELPYDVLVLPPYPNPDDMLTTPLEPLKYGDPVELAVRQLDN